MQVNQFIAYIKGEETIKNASENDIKTLVDTFPYHQSAHLLYAIQLNTNKSILFDEQLKKTAAYCCDREKMFNHLYAIGEDVELSHNKQPTTNATSQERLPITEPLITSEEKQPKKEKDDELATLEKEYLTQAINSSILLEIDEEKKSKQNLSIDSNKKDSLSDNSFDDNTSHSFSDWLAYYKGDIKSTTTPLPNEKKLDNELINKFIQEDPRITPNKTTFFSPIHQAKQSTENKGFVSETLAMIHVNQGNYEEAIKVYEKLMLNNPKKRSYFANQIKNLKQKIKS